MTSTLRAADRFDPDPVPSQWSWAANLSQILEDVRLQMGSDTATVLLLDRRRTVLEPAGTVGLDRLTRAAPSVPIGKGFAGRIAQSRQPLVIADLRPDDVINPILILRGVKSLVGVPIMVGSELLGVLHIGRFRSHEADDDEVLRLTELAGELGTTLLRRFIDDSHTAALALQRSLLPATLSVPDGIEIAARYVPADGDLGGDWYDVFELPDGRLAVVMGDVVGHGFEAAIIMGRLRSALRAYSLEHTDPAEILARLNRKICHFEPDCLATVLLGIAEAPYSEWVFSSAGHFAPVLAAPGETARCVEMPIDRLLGVKGDTPRRTTKVEIPIDGVMCLFTDGLVERRPTPDRRDRDLVEENIDLLRRTLTADDDPESACIHVLGEVVGDHVAEDDIALLVARRTSTPTSRQAAE